MRKLGRVQAACLLALKNHGSYHHYLICGWTYDTVSRTTKVLDSLAKQGLVVKDNKGWYSLSVEEEDSV